MDEEDSRLELAILRDREDIVWLESGFEKYQGRLMAQQRTIVSAIQCGILVRNTRIAWCNLVNRHICNGILLRQRQEGSLSYL